MSAMPPPPPPPQEPEQRYEPRSTPDKQFSQAEADALAIGMSFEQMVMMPAWTDILRYLDVMVEDAEADIMAIKPGESLEKRAATFIRYQERKVIRAGVQHYPQVLINNKNQMMEELNGNQHNDTEYSE